MDAQQAEPPDSFEDMVAGREGCFFWVVIIVPLYWGHGRLHDGHGAQELASGCEIIFFNTLLQKLFKLSSACIALMASALCKSLSIRN